MHEKLTIQSHRGAYSVSFMPAEGAHSTRMIPLAPEIRAKAHFVLDARVAELHADTLAPLLKGRPVLKIVASEPAKTLDRFTVYVDQLVEGKIRRRDFLVAVGGGVIQDITCFIAATLFRGLDWAFIPTTLLAQADSCIGSKSSINVGEAKNLLGTFTPPNMILIDPGFISTLTEADVHSGIGEMLKIHAIESPASFDAIAADYPRLTYEPAVLAQYLRRSLEIKKGFIEADEFDRGIRNVLNYGHSFGHAIEAATEFAVPHGIAVTIGMDMANFVAMKLGLSTQLHFDRMHPVLRKNYDPFHNHAVPMDRFFSALSKDKKNTSAALGLILPDRQAKIEKVLVENDARFREVCGDFFRMLLA